MNSTSKKSKTLGKMNLESVMSVATIKKVEKAKEELRIARKERDRAFDRNAPKSTLDAVCAAVKEAELNLKNIIN